MDSTKKRKFWFALAMFSFVGQVAWVVENMYLNVFIYNMFNASAGQISAMVSASAVVATLTTVFIGALSDKVGKRKIFISFGYILWGVSILGFALLRVDVIGALFPAVASAASLGIVLTIIFDCIMTFFGSTANDACFNAWLTDSTNCDNRGSAEGVNSMMPLIAILAVFGGFMSFDLKKASNWSVIYIIIGAVVLLIGIAGLFIIDEPKTETKENGNYIKNVFYGFRISVIKSNKILYATLLGFSVFGISIQVFMPYLILYYNKTLKLDNYVIIMAPAIIIAAIATLFWGKFYDKFHFIKSVVPSLFCLISGYVFLFFFENTALVFVGSMLMLCGYLTGLAVFGAMIRDYTPENKAGLFQGLRIVAQVLIPGVVGPLIGSSVLKNAEQVVQDDGTRAFLPNSNIFMAALVVSIFVWGIIFIINRLLKTEKEKET